MSEDNGSYVAPAPSSEQRAQLNGSEDFMQTDRGSFVLWLPGTFWTDHFERCADHPGVRREIKWAGKRVKVELDKVAVQMLGAPMVIGADHATLEDAEKVLGTV